MEYICLKPFQMSKSKEKHIIGTSRQKEVILKAYSKSLTKYEFPIILLNIDCRSFTYILQLSDEMKGRLVANDKFALVCAEIMPLIKLAVSS